MRNLIALSAALACLSGAAWAGPPCTVPNAVGSYNFDTCGNQVVNTGAPGSGGTVTANPPAVTPQATASAATSKVLKASAGNLYSFTGLSTVAGYYLVFDSATDPGNGAVTPKYCIGAYPANTVGGASWGSALASFSNGITVVFSTTGCFTETQSATAFISGQVSP